MVSNTFIFFWTLENRPIRWRTMYQSNRRVSPTLWGLVVTMWTTRFKVKKIQRVYDYFMWLSEVKAITSLTGINILVYTAKKMFTARYG